MTIESSRGGRSIFVAVCVAIAACGTSGDGDGSTTETTGEPSTGASTSSDPSAESSTSGVDVTGTGESGDSTAEGGGDGDPTQLVGTFLLQLDETPSTSLFGKVFDERTPSTVVWEDAMVDGDCRLRTPRVPFCATPCGSDACVEDDTCVPYPGVVTVGDVTVEGVATTGGATSFVMEPIADNYQPPAGTSLAPVAFAEGDEIRLAAAGGEFMAFDLVARGVAPLTVPAGDVALDEGVDLELVWDVPAQDDAVVEIEIDISHHGGTKGQIVCETADDGELVIGTALVDGLLALGVAGFPTIDFARIVRGELAGSSGGMALEVSSTVQRGVVIDGLVSCNGDEDCPDGQVCQQDLTCS